ncbi:MAG: tRNA lysidine(34) synthetase TilS, partial [Candidatus Competibacteraceae bacterium]|nr:tRNA lysidine(34) synthetase TilS [Candidatus Competibacteraceae bacterium]
ILTEMVFAARDARPLISWPGGEVRRHREQLYALVPRPDLDPELEIPWPVGQAELAIPTAGRLALEAVSGEGLTAARVRAGELKVRLRRGGERFRPRGRHHGQSLKKLLQEADIPPWERSRLPLLYLDGELAWVPGLGVAAQLTAAEGEAGLLPVWISR